MFWALGTIFGSVTGGVLAQPAKKLPNVFGGTVFETFPYLLPNLLSAFMLLLGLIATIVLLQVEKRKNNLSLFFSSVLSL